MRHVGIVPSNPEHREKPEKSPASLPYNKPRFLGPNMTLSRRNMLMRERLQENARKYLRTVHKEYLEWHSVKCDNIAVLLWKLNHSKDSIDRNKCKVLLRYLAKRIDTHNPQFYPED